MDQRPYRPNFQNNPNRSYVFSARAAPSGRPRFSQQAPIPNPRPRSSASKPNPHFNVKNDSVVPASNYHSNNSSQINYKSNIFNAVRRENGYENEAWNPTEVTNQLDGGNNRYANRDVSSNFGQSGHWNNGPYQNQQLEVSSNVHQSGHWNNGHYPNQQLEQNSNVGQSGHWNNGHYPNQQLEQSSTVGQSGHWNNGPNQQLEENSNFVQPDHNSNNRSFGNHKFQGSGRNVFLPVVAKKDSNNSNNYWKSKKALKRKAQPPTEPLHCDSCNLDFTSMAPKEMHMLGAKHKRRLEALKVEKELKSDETLKVAMSEDNPLHCKICDLFLKSVITMQEHLKGIKHRKKCHLLLYESQTPDETTEAAVEPQVTEERRRFFCRICNVSSNSQSQHDEHLTSFEHQRKTSFISFRMSEEQIQQVSRPTVTSFDTRDPVENDILPGF